MIGLIIAFAFHVLIAYSCYIFSEKAWPAADKLIHVVAAVVGFLFGLMALVVYGIIYVYRKNH